MKLSIIGCGAMGGAMAVAFSKCKDITPTSIYLSAAHESSLSKFKEMGMNCSCNNRDIAANGDIVILAVKPYLVKEIIDEIKESLDYRRQIIISVAAGVSGEFLLNWLDKGDGVAPKLLVAIPNTAIEIMQSMTFLSPISLLDDEIKVVEQLFAKCGSTKIIAEQLLPAAITLASCGIAYAMRYIRASIEGGVELGIKAKDAQLIVAQTVKGAAELLMDESRHPEAEIDKVTTPGGLTIRGLNAMEKGGFTTAVINGLKAGVK